MIAAILIGRKGSSGFPGKNTTQIAGHPMAWWPLEAARQTPEIDLTYVSTDDPVLGDIGLTMGARLIERPSSLASNAALGEDAFVHAHQVISQETTAAGAPPELYVLLMANAVTISPAQLTEGISQMRRRPDLDSAVTVSCYNMWSPLRARKITEDGLLQPFVPFEVFGDPATMNCDRDSQGDVWFADMGVSIVRPRNLDDLQSGMLPQKWMGQRIHPIKNMGGLDIDYPFQMPQAHWWLENQEG
jgi:hypothetical protein